MITEEVQGVVLPRSGNNCHVLLTNPCLDSNKRARELLVNLSSAEAGIAQWFSDLRLERLPDPETGQNGIANLLSKTRVLVQSRKETHPHRPEDPADQYTLL